MFGDPKIAAARRIVEICDKLLTVGRDPRPFVVTPHAKRKPTGRKAKGKKRKKPEAATELPVAGPPRWEPMSGPSGTMGCMGPALRDEQWETLWRELEKLAEEAAQLVPILDPEYRIDFYSDLRPRSLAQAVPELLPPRGGSRREERRRHIRRIWEERAKKGECPGCGEPLPTDLPPGQLLCHRGENCPPGKTDDEVIERLVAQWEDLDSRNLRIQYTQPQWPGRVMDIMGHRWFFFDPLLLHRFDERVKRLRFFAEQFLRAQQPAVKAPNVQSRFAFGSGQALFDGRDLGLPAGLAVDVLTKLVKSFGRTVTHQKLHPESKVSGASRDLRDAIRFIRRALEARKIGCSVVSKRGAGYLLALK